MSSGAAAAKGGKHGSGGRGTAGGHGAPTDAAAAEKKAEVKKDELNLVFLEDKDAGLPANLRAGVDAEEMKIIAAALIAMHMAISKWNWPYLLAFYAYEGFQYWLCMRTSLDLFGNFSVIIPFINATRGTTLKRIGNLYVVMRGRTQRTIRQLIDDPAIPFRKDKATTTAAHELNFSRMGALFCREVAWGLFKAGFLTRPGFIGTLPPFLQFPAALGIKLTERGMREFKDFMDWYRVLSKMGPANPQLERIIVLSAREVDGAMGGELDAAAPDYFHHGGDQAAWLAVVDELYPVEA
jgi:hypothetical protein